MELNSLEYNALIKLIHFVKYGCTDVEARYHAGSPIISEILHKLIIDFYTKINRDTNFEIENSTPLYNLIYNGVKENLKRTVEWNSMDIDTKKEHIKTLAFPYILDDSILKNLIKTINQLHNNKD